MNNRAIQRQYNNFSQPAQDSQQNQQIQKLKPRFEKFKILIYNLNKYIILFSEEKLIIFSGEMLDVIQTIRNFPANIITITSSPKNGYIYIFTDSNEVFVYAPILGVCVENHQGQQGKICWKQIHSQNLKFEAIDGYSSFDDSYLLTCGKNVIKIFELEQEYDEGNIKNLKTIFSLQTKNEIQNVKFSTDSRSFAIRQANSHNIYIYDFIHILTQDKGVYNLDEEDQVEKYELSHNQKIITFKFRDSIKHQNINQCPNTLISLDITNTLRIWQESLILNNWESNNEQTSKVSFTDKFYLLHSLKINFPIHKELSNNEINQQVTCSFVYFNSDLGKSDIQHDYLKNTEKRQFGNFEQDPNLSVDYISVFQENRQLKIYKITGLRNYGKTSKISLYFTIESKQFLHNIERISYLLQKKDGNNEYIEIFGWDGLNNLVKAVQNLNKRDENNEKELRIIYSGKYSFGNIIHAAFDTIMDNMCIFTIENQIRIQRSSPSQSIIPTQHRGIFRSFEQYKVQYKFKEDVQNLKQIFFHNNIIYMFPKSLSYFEFIKVNEQNNQEIINQQISLENVFQTLLGQVYIRRKDIPIEFEIFELKYVIQENEQIFYFAFKISRKILVFSITINLENEQSDKQNSENQDQNQNQNEEQNNDKSKQSQQQQCKLEFQNEYRFYCDFTIVKFFQFNVEDKSVHLLGSNEKNVNVFLLKDNSFEMLKGINKEDDIIKDIGYVNIYPSLIYVITKENEIHMHKENGELLCKFLLNQFLAFVDKSLYDIVNVRMSLKHLYDKNFILAIENYFLIVNLVYDQKTQQHILNVVKQSKLHNQVYYKRVSRFCDPNSYEVFLTKHKNIILKTSDKLKFLNSKFDDSVLNLDQIDIKNLSPSDFLPENIHSKILQSVKSIPHHHPEFLFELLSLGNFEAVQIILEKITQNIKKFGKISKKYTLNLELLSELFHPVAEHDQQHQQKQMETSNQSNQSQDNEEIKHLRKLAKRPSFQQQENLVDQEFIKEYFEENQDHLNCLEILQKICEEQPQCLGLNNMDLRKLLQIINFMQFFQDNQRGLDIYASQFLFHVNMIQQQRKNIKMNQQNLMTKEIAWAIHSLQKETIIQETVQKTIKNQGEEAMNWSLLKKYNVIIWYDNQPEIKKYIEQIAKNEYNKTKEPAKAALWYLLLGQIKVLAFLYRTSTIPNAKKMYELLQRDFKEERWKSAASKNGMVLLQRKDYELSAFFLLLAGKLDDAITVLIDKMKDIQLAILTAMLLDKDPEQPHFKRILETHFIGAGKIANDPFLSHIGYYLLGQHINSINTLYEFDYSLHHALEFKDGNKKVCQEWPSEFKPNLSSFHPCAITLAEKLKDTTQVKREIQEAENKSRKVQTMAQDFNWDDFGSDSDNNDDNQGGDADVPKIQENKQVHFELSIDYYLNINIPLLGLILFKNYDIQQNEETQNLQEKLLYKHLEFLLEEAILDEDYQNFFHNYNSELERFKEFFNQSLQLQHIQKMSKQKIVVLNSPKLSISINLAYNNLEQSLILLEKIAREVQNQIYIYCCDNQIKFIRQYFWVNLVYGLQEIDSGTKFIEKYLTQNKQKLDQKYKEKLKLIYFVRLSCELILDLGLEKFENIFSTLQKLQEFVQNQNSVFLAPVHEENYKSYLDSSQKITRNKQKNNKAHKFIDLYKDAFPTSPYDLKHFVDLSYNDNKQDQQSKKENEDDIDPEKSQLLKSLFEYLTIKKFLILVRQVDFSESQVLNSGISPTQQAQYKSNDIFNNSKSPTKRVQNIQQNQQEKNRRHKTLKFYPEILNEKNLLHILMQYKKMQKKIFIRLVKSFRNYEQLQILQELNDAIFANETGYQDTTHFYFLDKLIDPQIVVKIGKQINFNTLFNKIRMGMHIEILKNLGNRMQNENIEQEKHNLIKDGIEIYKLNRNETFKAFAIKNFQNQFTKCTLITNKGFRSFEVISNLLNKTRSQDGSQLLEEQSQLQQQQNHNNNTNNSENPYLQQKQLVNQNKQPYSVNIAAKMLCTNQFHLIQSSQQQNYKNKSEQFLTFQEFDVSEIVTYKQKEVQDMFKYSSLKSESDLQDLQSVVYHPNLPLIYTGGSKGAVNIWAAKSEQELLDNPNASSICVGELNFNSNGSNEYIETLKFNYYGDKLGGISNQGNFYLWKMNKLYKKPIFQVLNQKLTDFCFLNEGSVISAISQKNFFIIDTLLPGGGGRIVAENFGGNALYFMNNKYHILIINYKKNHVTIYDVLRKSVYKNIDLLQQYNTPLNPNTPVKANPNGQGSITSSLLSSSESALCLGFDNDTIKIFETLDYRLVNETRPFNKSQENQKKPSQIVQMHETQNALFASSEQGVIVLAYLSLN